MTADVNVIEKMTQAINPLLYPYINHRPGAAWAVSKKAATAALAALSDPEVLAGIAGVLRDTYARTACGGDPTAAGEVSDWLPEATAVVKWLSRQEQANE